MRVRVGALVFLVVLSAGTARAQAVVDVEFNGANAFHDRIGNTTSAAGVLAVTRIHEGDTVDFAWPAGGSARNHNVFPYAPALTRSPAAPVSVPAGTIMGMAPATSGAFTSTWDAATRSRPYQCTAHASAMNGVIYVYERAQRFAAQVPVIVAGRPFSMTVTAVGTNNTTDALYAGTVHLSSPEADAGMSLPADHAFTDADSGTHHFTGLVLTVPGPRTLVLSEAGGGITTQISVNVVTCQPKNTFTNPTPIVIPRPRGVQGAARPYPSVIDVAGVTGQVTRVTVTLRKPAHQRPQDVDVLLVGPRGDALVLLSDAAASLQGPFGMSLEALTLTDTPVASGGRTLQMKPVNSGANDGFGAPAPPPPHHSPAPAGTATLTGTFAGRDPNGRWSLYVMDDAAAASGAIAGGWTLSLDAVCP